MEETIFLRRNWFHRKNWFSRRS